MIFSVGKVGKWDGVEECCRYPGQELEGWQLDGRIFLSIWVKIKSGEFCENGHLLQTKKQMSWRFHPRDVDVKNTKRHTDDDEHKDINTLAVAVGEVKEESQNNERSTNLKKTSKTNF